MKTQRLLPLLAATLLLTVSPSRSRAADAPGKAGSEAPLDAGVVLRKIELSVALIQYEKVLIAIQEAKLQNFLIQIDPSLAEEQKTQVAREKLKFKALEMMRTELRDEIMRSLAETRAAAGDQQDAKVKAPQREVKRNSASQLQGAWEGVEVGREADGKCTMTIMADSIQFQGSNKGEWYKATYALPSANQLVGTITDCPVPEFLGKTTFALYKIEDGTLTLVGHQPGAPDAPKSFAGDAESRTFVFKKEP